ncbi:TauD/TfdA family dioxygenase [Streptomyces tateyamensis]|nr:TauD/TfdA family dioxygenase [Streptomyces tateyamensis]
MPESTIPIRAAFFRPWPGTIPAPLDLTGEELREHGAVGLSGLVSRQSVLTAARALTTGLRQHRDADRDGLTAIQDTGRHPGRIGYAGLGRTPLSLHTDGTHDPSPPRLLILACLRPGQAGGRTVLADGSAVLRELLALRPEAAAALTAARAAYFGGPDGRFSPVLEQTASGAWRIQLRQDELARFAPDTQPHLAVLRQLISSQSMSVTLGPGQAVVLDNHRVLHGRTGFTGRRLLLRALGDAHPHLRLGHGFMLPVSSPR